MADDPMNLLTSILSNPQAIDSIKNIIGSMAGPQQPSNPQPSVQDIPQPNVSESYEAPSFNQASSYIPPASGYQTQSMPDMSFITNLLAKNSQNIELMSKAKMAYDAYADNSHKSINLLNALSPYLNQNRTANLNKIITMVKVGRAASVFGIGKRPLK